MVNQTCLPSWAKGSLVCEILKKADALAEEEFICMKDSNGALDDEVIITLTNGSPDNFFKRIHTIFVLARDEALELKFKALLDKSNNALERPLYLAELETQICEELLIAHLIQYYNVRCNYFLPMLLLVDGTEKIVMVVKNTGNND